MSWESVQNIVYATSAVLREEIPTAKEVIQLFGGKYSVDFNDRKILLLLAVCAENCYKFDTTSLHKFSLRLVYQQEEDIGNQNFLQFGIYKITNGKYRGKRIMAFRGTDSLAGILQDISYALTGRLDSTGGLIIKATISTAIIRVKQQNPDFICGHSLGGLISECIASKLRIRGASFNSPGPWSHERKSNLSGNNYNKLPYEIHLTKGDLVSYVGCAAGPNFSHIGTPKWHDGPQAGDPVVNHSMREMVKNFE